MGIRLSSALVSAAVLASAFIAPALAQADIQHTVAKGHTIEAIANRYRVSSKAIIEANKLKDVKRLQPGDVLTIPGVNPKTPSPSKAKAEHDDAKKDKAKDKTKEAAKGKVADEKKPVTYAMKAKTPGVIHLKRIASTEEQDIRIADKHGKVSDSASKTIEKLLRSQSGLSHPVDKRLVQLLGVMSNHFGSRKIEVVSGFRPYTPTQYTAHSNHNHGKAIDFRVIGVPNEAVRDFCRTLKDVGCGYYPNSTFVHMDVRSSNAFWIDFSKPGEPPRYNAPNVDADEGTSDVHNDGHAATNTAPADSTTTTTTTTPAPTETPAPSPSAPSETPAAPATEESKD